MEHADSAVRRDAAAERVVGIRHVHHQDAALVNTRLVDLLIPRPDGNGIRDERAEPCGSVLGGVRDAGALTHQLLELADCLRWSSIVPTGTSAQQDTPQVSAISEAGSDGGRASAPADSLTSVTPARH